MAASGVLIVIVTVPVIAAPLISWGPANGETDIAHYDVQYRDDNGLTLPNSPLSDPAFTLSWTSAATDARDYDLQYRAVFSDSWRGWLTNTTDTQAQFTGDPGQAYYFRAQATDDVGNAGAWTVSSLVSIKSVTKYYHHGGARVAMRKDGEVYYLHGDHLGSTSLTTDSDGNVVSEARYHPFGTPRWQDGVAVTDFTFTSQRVERGFGLMDYNARYYDPYLGRFVSADTIVPDFANPQDLNRYS